MYNTCMFVTFLMNFMGVHLPFSCFDGLICPITSQIKGVGEVKRAIIIFFSKFLL